MCSGGVSGVFARAFELRSLYHPVNLLIYLLLGAICKVDTRDLPKISDRGPLILVTNHVTFLEVPILYLFLLPRPVVGVTKIETFDRPVIGYLARLWKAIPIRRNTSDRRAIMACVEALRRGRIVVIAPEGTRSGDGVLRRGSAGVIPIAALSGAPIFPVAHYGGERIWENLKTIRKTRFHIRVGAPIFFTPAEVATRSGRAAAIDQVMRSLAALMPKKYHGHYYESDRVAGYSVSKPRDD